MWVVVISLTVTLQSPHLSGAGYVTLRGASRHTSRHAYTLQGTRTLQTHSHGKHVHTTDTSEKWANAHIVTMTQKSCHSRYRYRLLQTISRRLAYAQVGKTATFKNQVLPLGNSFPEALPEAGVLKKRVPLRNGCRKASAAAAAAATAPLVPRNACRNDRGGDGVDGVDGANHRRRLD